MAEEYGLASPITLPELAKPNLTKFDLVFGKIRKEHANFTK